MTDSRSAMHIGLIRHGETDWNTGGLLQGRSDIPLNRRGLEQASQAGFMLARRGWCAVYSSPLTRAVATAERIASATGLPAPTPIADLIERDFGRFEGRSYFRTDGTPVDLADPSVESEDAVLARVLPALRDVARSHHDEDVLVVSHGSVILSVLDHVMGGQGPIIGNSTLSIIEVDAGGGMHVTLAGGFPVDSRTDEPRDWRH
ncbi:histidine phosphatase family protein [Pseudoclavibacter chungangensis]|uniref:histidine phosphatase family protein n=1 Tax=Pseudoclavibacter chungangensis TaxID=587635 RepID=UPI001787C577